MEFNTVVVLDYKMSRNQKYIAYTRALDELYVCSAQITGKRTKKTNEVDEDSEDEESIDKTTEIKSEKDSEPIEQINVNTPIISDSPSNRISQGNIVNVDVKTVKNKKETKKRKKIIIAIGNALGKRKQ